MIEIVTLRSLTVQIIFSPYLWLGNPVRISTNFSMWAEYFPEQLSSVTSCDMFYIFCDEMWIFVLSDELQLHMLHNYIIIYVKNW